MNIFFLDRDPHLAAKMQCDEHVVKMTLESAQMLSTCQHLMWQDEVLEPPTLLYRVTHQNHPCNVWLRQSRGNYRWMYEHFYALATEYTYRFGKTHLSWKKLGNILKLYPGGLPNGEFVDPPQCMPDEFKNSDTVVAYRDYYIHGKYTTMKTGMHWRKGRPAPGWWPHLEAA